MIALAVLDDGEPVERGRAALSVPDLVLDLDRLAEQSARVGVVALAVLDANVLTGAMSCLERRIQQELHLSTHPQMDLLGLAWDKNQTESQHFGVMFRVPVVSDYVADHLKNEQFKKMGRSGRLKSIFMTQEEILRGLDDLDLEPWSEHMVRNIKLSRECIPE